MNEIHEAVIIIGYDALMVVGVKGEMKFAVCLLCPSRIFLPTAGEQIRSTLNTFPNIFIAVSYVDTDFLSFLMG